MIVIFRRRLSAKRRFCLRDEQRFYYTTLCILLLKTNVSSTTPFVLILFDVSLIGHARILVLF